MFKSTLRISDTAGKLTRQTRRIGGQYCIQTSKFNNKVLIVFRMVEVTLYYDSKITRHTNR